MSLFLLDEWVFAEAAADLVTTNPFDVAWRQKERELFGTEMADVEDVYGWKPGWGLWGPRSIDTAEMRRAGEQMDAVASAVRKRLQAGATGCDRELEVYETLALYTLYVACGENLDLVIDAAVKHKEETAPAIKDIWGPFRRDHKDWLQLPGHTLPWTRRPEHLFACFFALRRAFYHIFFNIVGRSRPAVRLRSAVWQSVVTHDLRGWVDSHYDRMRDFPTLITGPSGTGKELVAQAVGRSQSIPFDAKKQAVAIDFIDAFQPVNLSALPPLLIESELFGHVKGSFASAIRDRVGRLEECSRYGAVFLDEVAELTGELQVKLLRLLQARSFQRVGENQDRWFEGKVMAATSRDLGAEMAAGRFREDFYYRLCADRIQTPFLREQLADRPADLPLMVEFICRRVVGEAAAERLTAEVVAWIESHLGAGYAWPGNFRELEQCVRNVMIRQAYEPVRARPAAPDDPRQALAAAVLDGTLTAAELERRYFTLVFAQCGSYQEAGRRLGCNWRTLRRKIDRELLRRLGRPPA